MGKRHQGVPIRHPGHRRFLHQHVLARQQHLPDQGGMLGVDHRHIDGVHLGALGQGLIAAIGKLQPLLTGELVGPPLIPGGDRHHTPAPGVLIDVAAKTPGDGTRPGDPPAQQWRGSL